MPRSASRTARAMAADLGGSGATSGAEGGSGSAGTVTSGSSVSDISTPSDETTSSHRAPRIVRADSPPAASRTTRRPVTPVASSIDTKKERAGSASGARIRCPPLRAIASTSVPSDGHVAGAVYEKWTASAAAARSSPAAATAAPAAATRAETRVRIPTQ
jgi:hypothetical protein